MKVSTMRIVDRLLGVPVCFLLTVLRRCGNFWRLLRKQQPAQIRRILFVKLAEQGATVLAYPALQQALQRVGRQGVYFLVFEDNRFILDVMEVIPPENVIPIRTDTIRSLMRSTLRALWRMWKLRIDAAIDFEFFARSSAALTYLSGACLRVGFHSFSGEASYRGDLMTHRLSYNPHIHTSQTFQMMVAALDCPPKQLPAMDMDLPAVQSAAPPFNPSPEEIERYRAVVERQAGTGEFSPLILLNANASDLLPLRRWPAGRYVLLARKLLERSPDVRIAFTGSPKEAVNAEGLVAAVDNERCFSLAGKTALRELLILYCLADALITNDSGPALFATLTPIHVVTLFGPETPKLFGLRSPKSHILWKNIPCSPCVNAYNNRLSACKNNVCMQRISVEEVFDVVCQLCEL